MRTMFKKAVSVLLATAVLVSGAAVTNNSKAEAAAKSATITSRLYFAGVQGKENCKWLAGDGKTAKSVTKKVKLTKGKKANVTLTVKNSGAKISAATVFTVDMVNVLKTFKNVKFSNVVVKADGKKKPAKVVQGRFEPKDKNNSNNWRLSIYNSWGNNGDNSKSVNKAKNYAFKKTLSVSFTVVAK